MADDFEDSGDKKKGKKEEEGGADDWGDLDNTEEGAHGGNEKDQQEDVLIENLFYEAGDHAKKNPQQALDEFLRVVKMEEENKKGEGKWRFKALENVVSLYHKLGRMKEMLESYQRLLTYVPSVTQNESSESINAILALVANDEQATVSRVYEVTLAVLKKAGNQERLWFQIQLKLARTYLEQSAHDKMTTALREAHDACKLPDGSDDRTKGGLLIEVYALYLQLYSALKDKKMLKEVFAKTKDLSGEITEPRAMSVVRECWGKMYGDDGQWDLAYTEFYQAFRLYQEIGNPRAKQCLKYVVIANMLAGKSENPFDAREAKAYQKDLEIEAMSALRFAHERGDIKRVEKLLKEKKREILGDPFISDHLSSLMLSIRAQTLVSLIRPYRRIRIDFIAKQLNSNPQEVEQLLVRLILDQKVNGRIDQANGFLDLTLSSTEKKYESFDKWKQALNASYNALLSKIF